MYRIRKIELVNFRSYYDEYKIEIEKGNNLLIYGENGSGKSSLYEGLKNFFLAADSTEDYNIIRHNKVSERKEAEEGEEAEFNEVSVKLDFHDFETNDTLNKALSNIDGIENVVGDKQMFRFYEQTNFISYRELLKTHLIDDLYDEELFKEKFADLVINQLLANKKNPDSGNPYKLDWQAMWKKRKWQKYKELKRIDFDNGLKKDIALINLHINRILNYFDSSIEVRLLPEDTTLEYETQYRPYSKIGLECKLNGVKLNLEGENHLTILNEARLSSIALSIFLAAIVVEHQEKAEFRFIFMDDIFMGLDLSNRIPLLRVLNEYTLPLIEEEVDDETGKIVSRPVDDPEAEPFFNQYQIFVTTYDRHWFELAKNMLGNNWHKNEMYNSYNETLKFELPLLQTSESYYEKADYYYKRNNDFKDYPAAANYLRKDYEQLIRNILPENMIIKMNQEQVKYKDLGELLDALKSFVSGYEYEADVFEKLYRVKDTLLNPLSHDAIQTPVYKTELELAFRYRAIINSIKYEDLKILKPDSSKYIYYKESNSDTGEKIKYKIKLLDNLRIYNFFDTKWVLSKSRCVVVFEIKEDGRIIKRGNYYETLKKAINRLAGFLNVTYDDDQQIIEKLEF